MPAPDVCRDRKIEKVSNFCPRVADNPDKARPSACAELGGDDGRPQETTAATQQAATQVRRAKAGATTGERRRTHDVDGLWGSQDQPKQVFDYLDQPS